MAEMGLSVRYMDPAQLGKFWGESETMVKELEPLMK